MMAEQDILLKKLHFVKEKQKFWDNGTFGKTEIKKNVIDALDKMEGDGVVC